MRRRLETLRLASAEFEASVRWYEERRHGLGAELYDAGSHTTDLIAEQPELGQVVEISTATRRVSVSRFPCQVVYHLTPATIFIVAIAHLKRRPNYWKNRR